MAWDKTLLMPPELVEAARPMREMRAHPNAPAAINAGASGRLRMTPQSKRPL